MQKKNTIKLILYLRLRLMESSQFNQAEGLCSVQNLHLIQFFLGSPKETVMDMSNLDNAILRITLLILICFLSCKESGHPVCFTHVFGDTQQMLNYVAVKYARNYLISFYSSLFFLSQLSGESILQIASSPVLPFNALDIALEVQKSLQGKLCHSPRNLNEYVVVFQF